MRQTADERRQSMFMGKVEKVYRGPDGLRLVRKRYKVPLPDFRSGGCGSRPITSAEPDYVVELLYAHAVADALFRETLNQLQQGLGDEVLEDSAVGIGWQGPAGTSLRLMIRHAHDCGLSQYLIRATMIDSEKDQQRFLAAWADEHARQLMLEVSPLLLSGRDEAAEVHLARQLRKWGLRLRPAPPVKSLDGKPVEPTRRSLASEAMKAMVSGLSGLGGG